MLSEGGEWYKGVKGIFKEIKLESFPELMKDMNLQKA